MIAFNESNLTRSRAELAEILDDRASSLFASFDGLLIANVPRHPPMDVNGGAYETAFNNELLSIRAEAERLVKNQRQSLLEGNLVRSHEIGNEINVLGNRVDLLIGNSNARQQELGVLTARLSMMDPTGFINAKSWSERETARNSDLTTLGNEFVMFCKRPVCG